MSDRLDPDRLPVTAQLLKTYGCYSRYYVLAVIVCISIGVIIVTSTVVFLATLVIVVAMMVFVFRTVATESLFRTSQGRHN